MSTATKNYTGTNENELKHIPNNRQYLRKPDRPIAETGDRLAINAVETVPAMNSEIVEQPPPRRQQAC